jgi:LuxR family transcriptional regulator, quorum-sensing system regulator BjaR1
MMAATAGNYARVAFELIEKFDRANSPEEVVERLAAALSALEYEPILIKGAAEPPERVEPYFLKNGWPREPSGRAKENDYIDDPTAAWCRRTVSPFEWSKTSQSVSIANAQTTDHFGSRKVVPIIRASGANACVMMAGERPHLKASATNAIHLVSLAAHAKAVSLVGAESQPVLRAKLTPREREVLHWTAAGKSSWDISVILGISERTVNWLIARATRKLNAVNRTQAVVNAVRAGEIFI